MKLRRADLYNVAYMSVAPSDCPPARYTRSYRSAVEPRIEPSTQDILGAIIETESVLVVAAFFYGISAGCSRSDFILNTWDGRAMVWFPNMKLCREFWEDVRDSVCEAHG